MSTSVEDVTLAGRVEAKPDAEQRAEQGGFIRGVIIATVLSVPIWYLLGCLIFR